MVVIGMFEVPAVAGASDVIGVFSDFVVLHVPVAGWFRTLFRTLFASNSVLSPSELERPLGLQPSDGDLAS